MPSIDDCNTVCSPECSNPEASEVDAPQPAAAAARPPENSVEDYGAPNGWAAAVGQRKKAIDDFGAQALTRSHQEGQAAGEAFNQGHADASHEWSQGHWANAAWEEAKGVGNGVAHQTAAFGNLALGVQAAEASGIADVAMGDKTAVKKVAIGGAAVAVMVAAPEVLAAGATMEGGVAALGAVSSGLRAYGIIEGSGQILRAENAGQAALGGAEVALAAAGPAMGKGFGAVFEELGEASGLAEWVGASHGVTEIASHALGEAAAHGLSHSIERDFESVVDEREKKK
jgi:hypothetical protein